MYLELGENLWIWDKIFPGLILFGHVPEGGYEQLEFHW
jgi:hypothetical protein